LRNSEKSRKSANRKVNRPLEMEFREGESWIVKTTETIKLVPKVKQIVVGKLEMPKRRESRELVCVKPAQLPQDGVLAARGLFRTFTKSPQSTSLGAVNSMTAGDQLSGI
jgi:hypothetical protein